MYKYVLPILFLWLTNCTTITPIQEKSIAITFEKIANAKYGKGYATLENISATYVIVYKKHKKLEELMATVNFFIYEKKTSAVIFEDELNAGSVKWINDYEVRIISRNQGSNTELSPTIIYYFDVLKKEKRFSKNN